MSKLSQGVIFVFLLVATLLTSPFYVYASTEVFDDVTVDTTWTVAESPYVINFPTTVYPGATLSIDPGVVVKFEGSGSLVVEGALQAAGTTSEKIHFTSIKDDSVGGDTNADGASTLPSVSDWQGILFMNASSPSTVANAEVRFAGVGIENHGSDISVSDTVLSNLNSGIISFASEDMLTNVSFSNIGQSALLLFDNSEANVNNLSLVDLGEFADGINLFSNSVLRLDNSTLSGSLNTSGVSVYEGSDVYIDGSIISGFNTAFADYGSGSFGPDSISIKNSQIKNNKVGIQLFANDSILSVSKNTIHDNTINGVESYAEFTANLKNNFWSDPTGPYNEFSNPEGLGNGVFYIPDYNNVLFKPWLASWPSEPAPCCSSVIFVPGFEGSRLYERRGNGGLTQRWEPGIASLNDVRSLFMDVSGNSVKNNIVTKDIIERTNYTPDIGNVNIYKKISDWLRNSKTSETISDFFLFPYDWRSDNSDIVNNGTKTDVGVIKLKDKIVALAQSSKTGKVTLTGHSNGGLIIKKAIESLKSSGQENLVDKVVLVASPQLGTPHALGSLLHGDDTEFLNGIVLNSITARLWAQNMPGVYGLIPSEKLYQKLGSFIKFDSPLSTNWRDLYGEEIDYSEQAHFLTGGDGRRQPNNSDLQKPEILRQSILDKATALHNSIDNLQYPANIEVYEIAGIGRYTRQSLTYKSALLGLGSLYHESVSDISCNGDKTVIIESAIDKNQNPFYLDLYDYNKLDIGQFGHANIMENPEVVKLISNIITDGTESTPHITSTKPSMDKCKFKRFGMFSPADIDVYDSEGRHVGINKEQSTEIFKVFDTEIPGSDFYMIGDQKFAIVPDEGEYTVDIDGTGNGLYTLEITTHEDNQVTNQTSFSDLPVTPALKGSLFIDTQSGDEPVLSVDKNGDGVVDQEVLPNYGASPLSYLEVVRATILELELSKKLEKSLLQQVDRVITLVKKNKVDKATEKLQKFLRRIGVGHKITKEMTQVEKDDLVNKINSFLTSL